MHPFGTNGVGSSGLMFYPVPANGTTARTNGRDPLRLLHPVREERRQRRISPWAGCMTSLYANVARIDNKAAGVRFNVGMAPTVPGGNSSGFEAGVRHSF